MCGQLMVTVHSVCRCKCYLEMSDSDATVQGSNKEPVLAVDAARDLFKSCMKPDSIGKQQQLHNNAKSSLKAAGDEIQDALEKVGRIEPTDGRVSVCRAQEALKFLNVVLSAAYKYIEAIEEWDEEEASDDDRRNLENMVKQLTEGRAGDVVYMWQKNNLGMFSEFAEYLKDTGRGAGFWPNLCRHVTGHLGSADDEQKKEICKQLQKSAIDTLRVQGVGWEEAEATWKQELMRCITDDDDMRSLVYHLIKNAADAESAHTEQANALNAAGAAADHGLDLACHEDGGDTADAGQQKRKAPETGTVLTIHEEARLRRVKQQLDKIEGK